MRERERERERTGRLLSRQNFLSITDNASLFLFIYISLLFLSSLFPLLSRFCPRERTEFRLKPASKRYLRKLINSLRNWKCRRGKLRWKARLPWPSMIALSGKYNEKVMPRDDSLYSRCFWLINWFHFGSWSKRIRLCLRQWKWNRFSFPKEIVRFTFRIFCSIFLMRMLFSLFVKDFADIVQGLLAKSGKSYSKPAHLFRHYQLNKSNLLTISFKRFANNRCINKL